MKKLRMVSLFSGIGAFEKGLKNIGVPFELVNFCEVDKYATRSYCAIHDLDESANLGDITKIDLDVLPKNIDLLTHGSPCQSYSRAGKMDMRIGLDDEIRSGLFLQCNRVLKEVNPKYFLMENVIMKKEDEEVISKLMGVSPIRINSKQVTAQMRDRLYWTNINVNKELEEKEIKVNDILKDGYYPFDKARCLMKNDSHGYYNGCNWTPSKRFYRWYYKAFSTMVFPKKEDFDMCLEEFNRVVNGRKATAKMFDDYDGDIFNCARYLWKEERARLQTIPDKYIKNLSEKDASDLIGDGWTVDVIAHILSFIK